MICIQHKNGSEEHLYQEMGKNGKLTVSKLKSSCLSQILDETMPLIIDNQSQKKEASVSEELSLFNWSSVGYI